jgi:hypothetical protein
VRGQGHTFDTVQHCNSSGFRVGVFAGFSVGVFAGRVWASVRVWDRLENVPAELSAEGISMYCQWYPGSRWFYCLWLGCAGVVVVICGSAVVAFVVVVRGSATLSSSLWLFVARLCGRRCGCLWLGCCAVVVVAVCGSALLES